MEENQGCYKQSGQLSGVRLALARNLDKSNVAQKTLKQRCQNAQLVQEKLKSDILECEERCVQLCTRSEQTTVDREKLLRLKESLEPQVELLRDDVASKLKVLEKQSKAQSHKVVCNERVHTRLTGLLGLRVLPKKSPTIGSNLVQVEFTNIDANDPDRKFLFLFKTSTEKTVTVTDSDPKIPHGLKRAVEKLNHSNPRDFHSFCVWIRNEFVKLSASS